MLRKLQFNGLGDATATAAADPWGSDDMRLRLQVESAGRPYTYIDPHASNAAGWAEYAEEANRAELNRLKSAWLRPYMGWIALAAAAGYYVWKKRK